MAGDRHFGSQRTAGTCLDSFYVTSDNYNVSICAQTSQDYFASPSMKEN